MLVLLIDASLHSRSAAPQEQLSAARWVDRVLPVVAASTEEGQQLAAIWAQGLTMSASTLSSDLNQIEAGAASAYHQVETLHPPSTLLGAAGLLQAALLARRDAATAVAQALLGQISPDATGSGPAVSAIEGAVNDMVVGDRAYQLFAQSMPRGSATLPPSVWAGDLAPYKTQTLAVFLASLRNAVSTAPVHEIKIFAVSTTPAPVTSRSHGNVEVLPDATAMTLTVVIADTGNQEEKGLTLTASISSSNGTSSVRDFLDLQPGQARTIVGLGPLNPAQGVDVTLTVTVTPPAGSSTPPATQSLTFWMPGPPPSSTTSTPPPSTTSTPPAGASSTTAPAGASSTTRAPTSTTSTTVSRKGSSTTSPPSTTSSTSRG